MKKLLFLLLLLLSFAAQAQQKMKVACLGSDNTHGTQIANRNINSYPAQLGSLLGPQAEVKNFGAAGATLGLQSAHPYLQSPEFEQAAAYAPDVVIVEFDGLNNQPYGADQPQRESIEQGYKALLKQIAGWPKAPRILLLSPLPIYTTDGSVAPTVELESFIETIPAVEWIDTRLVYGPKHLSYLMEDGRHITSTGAYYLASRLNEYLLSDFEPTKPTAPEAYDRYTNGYKNLPLSHFTYRTPRRALTGRPWVMAVSPMAAPIEKQLEQSLLERGFHVISCLPQEMNACYNKMWRMGMSDSVILLTSGDYGRQVSKWANKHSKQVMAIYADTIVNKRDTCSLFHPLKSSKSTPVITLKRPGKSDNTLRTLVNFMMGAAGRRVIETTVPVPGNESRWRSVGWTENASWHEVSKEINDILQQRKVDVLLLGNSITQAFGGTRQMVTHKPGFAPLTEALGSLTWESAGVNSDRVQHLLWRLRNGNYGACAPKYVIITIGVNNMGGDGDLTDEIVEGVMAVVSEAQKQMPQAEVILFGMLPAQLNLTDDIRQRVDAAHARFAQLQMPAKVTYINPTSWFTQPDGTLITELYAGDRLHLTAKGYTVWSQHIAEIIKGLEARK